jgi:NAD(P)-dependent dehydrogenase (short-subunit alcohol dehydrogenase family)
MEKNIFDLSGRVAVVTGGGNGLGRAFCEGLAEFGADVACVDWDWPKAEETVELIQRSGHKAIAIRTDVSQPSQVESMVKETVSELGTIDILINDAGITAPGTNIIDTPLEVWEKVLAVDLTGVFLCMRAVLPVMLKQKRGSIINIASTAAFGAVKPGVIPPCYSAAKAGVVSLTKAGAIEHGRDGIRVNCIAPGMFDTRLGTLPDSEEEKKRRRLFLDTMERDIPMGRAAQPREMKGLGVFLASDASSYVTGQVFVPDGGYLAMI